MVEDNPRKTPRTGTPALPPPRPIPTLATVQTTIEAVMGQVKGLRLELEALTAMTRYPDVLRVSRVPSPASLLPSPVPEPRPSMAAKAAHGAGKWGKVAMIATGALTVVGQVVALWKPEYTGPIVQALRLLASLGGGDP